MSSPENTRAQWLALLLSTEPADRERAQESVRALYQAAAFGTPSRFCWFDSPFTASWAVALLVEPHHQIWRDLLRSARKTRGQREQVERAEAALQEQCGVATLAEVRVRLGNALGTTLTHLRVPGTTIHMKVVTARIQLAGGDVSGLFARATQDDVLSRAEQYLWAGSRAALSSGLVCAGTGSLITQSFFTEYTFSMMAGDEDAAAGREPPSVLRAAWAVARASGMWWPFGSGAVLTERPSELHVDERGLLHRTDGPALVYRDGASLYAWHGMTVPEKWIVRPETVSPREVRGLDPTLRRHIESRRAAAPATARRAKPSAIFKEILPSDPQARLAALRAHAGGVLGLFDRYRAGEHEAVWAELAAAGPAVRSDPLAADALAVTYELMSRVDANVKTLVSRLREMRYEFTDPDGRPRRASTVHVPPGSRVYRQLQRLEKSVGTLPLSLRVFYELVGAVDLIGRHPTIAPTVSDVAPDPLVVAGLEEVASDVGSWDDDSELVIAPDDLHKSGTSGGDPYAIGVPDEAVDARLMNERHELLFVDYLRLCCRFGGFPGYDGRHDAPADLDRLREGLVEF